MSLHTGDTEHTGGAAEHTRYMEKGCVVSLNIGLPGGAVKGKQWNTHRQALLEIFVTALIFSSDTIGMLVSEVGSVTDPYDTDDRDSFDLLFKEAFQTAGERTGATEHGEIQIFWATGNAAETVMIFKSHVNVKMLKPIFLPHSWRRVEVALINGDTDHDEVVSMLIYNTHQPSSTKVPFKPNNNRVL